MSLFCKRKCPVCESAITTDALYMGLHVYMCQCGACHAANVITEVMMQFLPFDGHVMGYVGCGYFRALWMYFTYPWDEPKA